MMSKARLFFWVLGLTVIVSFARGEDLVTINGTTYIDAKVTNSDGVGVKIVHRSGAAYVAFNEMTDADKIKYGYDPKKEEAVIADKRRQEEKLAKLSPTQREYLMKWKRTGKPYPFRGPFNVGSIGTFNEKIRVQQILTPSAMIAEVTTLEKQKYTVSEPMYDSRGEVRVWSEREGLLPKSKDVWIEGVSTSGLADNQELSLSQVFEIKSTKSYRTAIGGNRTLLLLQPFDLSLIVK